MIEVANRLGLAIDLKHEVVADEPRDQRVVFIANDGRDDDQLGVDRNGGGIGRCGWRGRGLLTKGQGRKRK